jgi:hypothetical protein
MESSCLDVPFCIKIYGSGVVLVRVLISCAPVVDVLNFFPPGAIAVSERGMLDMLPLAGFLLWCWLPPFSSQ